MTHQAGAQSFHEVVLDVLGHAPALIEPGRLHRFATCERHADTAGWCKLFEDQRGGVFGCHRQGVSQTWSAADRSTMTSGQRSELARQVMAAMIERKDAQHQRWSMNAQRNTRLWLQCLPLTTSDPVARYLMRRGFDDLWPLPAVLRLHPGLTYWQGGEPLGIFPALLAPLVAPDGRKVALHRTY